ncbi:MAG: hypothetical protein R2716_05710 [Microthrixaceae bacterium]
MALEADGSTTFDNPFGLQVGLDWVDGASPGSNSTDTGLTVVAFGGPSLGDLDRAGGLDIAAPTTGLGRALDTLLPNDQPGDNQLTGWDGATGHQLPGYPRVTGDLAFFVTPAVADVDGDGRDEIVAGHGVQMLDAVGTRRGAGGAGAGAHVPAGWPKLTGGWVIGTPAVGDWDGNGTAELAVTRRDGPLLVWSTPTDASQPGAWTRYGGGPTNAGTSAG